MGDLASAPCAPPQAPECVGLLPASPSRLSCAVVFSPVPLSGSTLLAAAAASLCSSASGKASRSFGSTHPAPAPAPPRSPPLPLLPPPLRRRRDGRELRGREGSKGKVSTPTPTVMPDEAYLEAVTHKRIRLFEEIQTRQVLERLNIGGEPINFIIILERKSRP